MPKVEAGESREHYMERCMIYPDLQKHDEKQRTAICEHLYDREEKTANEGVLPPDSTLYEQTVMEKPRIDREAGVIRRVHVLGLSSRVVTPTGFKERYRYSLDGIRKAAPFFEGLCVGINHDYTSSPLKVGDTWGTLNNPSVDDEGVWADLSYLKTHTLTEQLLEDIERGTKLFALSCANSFADHRGNEIVSFRPMRVDVVAGGGATTKTLLEQAAPPPVEVVEPAKAVETVTKLCFEQEIQELKDRLAVFEQQQQNNTNLQETIAKTTKGFDLSKFWHD